MKKWRKGLVFILAIGLLLGSMPFGVSAEGELPTDLIGYWQFDEDPGSTTAINQVTGGGDFLLPNNILPSFGTVGDKKGLFLPQNATSYPALKDFDVNLGSNFTMSFYYQGDASVAENETTVLFAKGPKTTGHYEVWMLDGQLAFYAPELNAGNAVYSGVQIADGTLHKIAITYDGATMKFYVDDVLKKEQAVSGSIADGVATLTIGYVTDTLPYRVYGFLSDLRLYGKALTEQEIIEGSTDGLITRWAFDEDPGENVAQEATQEKYDIHLGEKIDFAREGQEKGLLFPSGMAAYPAIQNYAGNLRDQFSIEMVVRVPENVDQTVTLVAKGPKEAGHFELWLNQGKLAFYAPELNNNESISTDISVADNVVHKIAVTYDGKTMIFYVDDMEKAAVPVTGSISDATSTLTVGAQNDGTYAFSGFIDELKFRNTVQEYDPYEANLLSKWKFNEQTGSILAKNEIIGAGDFVIPQEILSDFAQVDGQKGLLLPENASAYPVLEGFSGNVGSNFTLSCFYKGDQSVADKGTAVLFGKGPKTTGHYELWLYEGRLAFFAPEIHQGQLIDSGVSVTDDVLHKIDVTYDGATMKFYVDDEMVKAVETAGSVSDSTGAFTIGHAQDTLPYPIHGFLSDIRIYNKALTQEEVTAKTEENLVARWKLDEDPGSLKAAEATNPDYAIPIRSSAPFAFEALEEMQGIRIPAEKSAYPSIQNYAENLKDSFTIHAVVQAPEEQNSPAVILAKGPKAAGHFEMWLNNGALAFYAPDLGTDSFYSPIQVADGKTHQIAVTYDGEMLIFYIDGRIEYTSYASGAIQDSQAPLSLGALNDNTFAFQGFIDELCIYNTALPQEAFSKYYQPGEEEDPDVPPFTPKKLEQELTGPLYGLDRMLYPQSVPLIDRSSTIGYEGSMARIGDNSDWDWELYQDENGEYVLFEVDGPGCIFNFTQHRYPTSEEPTFNFYFDGASEPQFSIKQSEFGTKAPFLSPLSDIYEGPPEGGRGPIWVIRSFVPMMFSEHAKITSTVKLEGNDKALGQGGWGHVTYQTYDTPDNVTTYTGEENYEDVLAMLENCGKDPKYAEENLVFDGSDVALAAGESLTLLDETGEGAVASIQLSMAKYTPEMLQDLWIRIHWDGHQQADVLAPIGTFFGNEYGKNAINNKTLLLGVKTLIGIRGEFYNYYPMPYWESAKIELVNQGQEDVTVESFEVQVTPSSVLAYPKESTGYFTSSEYYPLTENVWGKNSHIGTIEGTGHMAYGVLTGLDIGAGCEGDVRVFIDGKGSPVMESDGSESWASYGWGFVTPPECNPYSMYDGIYGSNSGWSETRLTVMDTYNFKNSIRFELEHGGANDGLGRHSGQFFCYLLEKDYEGMTLTDLVDVGTEASETYHEYTAEGDSQIVECQSRFANGVNNTENAYFTDSGRAGFTSSSFKVSISKENEGVVLHRLSDQTESGQNAQVFVDGERVMERDWFYGDYNPYDRWAEDEFQIPASYTRGKDSITITIVPQEFGGVTTWNEYRYRVFSILDEKPEDHEVAVKNIMIDRDSLALQSGDTAQLAATVFPMNATNQRVEWSTSDKAVATVDETGCVTAVADGIATITATTVDGGYTANCLVTVGVAPDAPLVVWQAGFQEDGTIAVVFNKAVDKSAAEDTSHYALEPGAVVLQATLDETGKKVTLTVSDVEEREYALKLSGITDTTGKTLSATEIVVDRDLVAYWTFDEKSPVGNIFEMTGRLKEGTAQESLETTGILGNGLGIESAINRLTIPDVDINMEEGFSLSFWAKRNSLDDDLHVLFAKGAKVEGHFEVYLLGDSTLMFYSPDAGLGNRSFNTKIEDLNWHHIAVVVRQGTMYFYVDGRQTAAFANTALPARTTMPFYFGGTAPENEGFIHNGALDDFRIYKRALTDEEIKQMADVQSSVSVKSVSLDKETAELEEGDSLTLVATVLPENATNKNVTWSSSDDKVATVDATGKVTAVAEGEATITVTTEDGEKTATCVVTVKEKSPVTVPVESVSLDKETAELEAGQSLTLVATVLPEDATNKNVTWSSSDDKVATVDATGKVTAVAEGEATITVTTQDGAKTATCVVTVKKASEPGEEVLVSKLKIAPYAVYALPGDEMDLTVEVTPANATNKAVRWESSDESVATVDQNGHVKVLKVGKSRIYAIALDGSGVTCYRTVTVRQPVEKLKISPYSVRVFVGEELDLDVEVTPANASVQDVTWRSENPEVATVDQNGYVVAKSVGASRIYAEAKDGSGVYCYRTVTVYGPLVGNVAMSKSVVERNSWENTRVTYNLNYNGYVDIGIYNTKGQLVRTLRDQLAAKAANGRYATWNLKNDKGEYVPAGTYYAQVSATLPTGELTTIGTATVTVKNPAKAVISGYKVTANAKGATYTYTLNTKAAANFYVYDKAGKVQIVKKINNISNAGTSSYVWDGRDANGKPVPKGTYQLNMYAWNSMGKSTLSRATVTIK